MVTPQELVERALEGTTAAACSVVLRDESTANLRWANNTLTTNGVTTSTVMSVVAHRATPGGMSTGVVTAPVASAGDVAEVVARADAAAEAAARAEDASDPVAGETGEEWDLPPGATSVDVFERFAPDLGEALRRARQEDRLLYGYAEHSVETTYLATSGGVRARFEQPVGHVGITAKPADLSASAWVGQPTGDFADVDVAALDAELLRRLGWASTTVALPAGRYQTLLPPTAVADLVDYAYFVSSGRDAAEGRTVFSSPGGGTKVGQAVARRGVRLSSDPRHPEIAACPFVAATATDAFQSVFDNGLPVEEVAWVDDGTLRRLPTSRHTARLSGLPVSLRPDNLVLTVDGGAGSVDELAAATSDRALLLTCLWYIRQVDPQELLLTGLTRDGVYLVEGGEVVGAVNNFRFNESPVSLLNRFSQAGTTQRCTSREWGDFFPRTAMPALRIPDFNMSSVSPAS